MKRLIVGTAGHIDHGKTKLIEALTSVDCDRFSEEKARGITIDLGFAHLERDDLQIGFVDVPGHERFLHNALAGLGGIDAMLLVVAADEGVKPQTREHLGICSLLGIRHGVIALTKSDLVDTDLLELATLELSELLAETPFREAPILAVSSQTRSGLDGLVEVLTNLAQDDGSGAEPDSPTDTDSPARLPIDRAFQMKGMGAIVTGTLVSGAIEVGGSLRLAPAGHEVRVRGVQVHGETRPVAVAGERCAIQIAGVDFSELRRGEELVEPQAYPISDRLLIAARKLPQTEIELNGWVPVRLHLYAAEVLGRMRRLEGSFDDQNDSVLELRLARPIVAHRGDRVILRRPSPPLTIGGGTVLDPTWQPLRAAQRARAISALTNDDRSAALFWAERGDERGLSTSELAQRLGQSVAYAATMLESLQQEQELLAVDPGRGREFHWVRPKRFARLTERAHETLQTYFGEHRLALGMPKAEFSERLFRSGTEDLVPRYLDWLERQGTLVVDGNRIDLPGRSTQLEGKESALAEQLVAAYRAAGLTPASPPEIARQVEAAPRIVQGVVDYLIERNQLTSLPGGLIIASSVLDDLREELRATGWQKFSVSEFKDRFSLSRKWAIPLLEQLDSAGVTRRHGAERLLVAVAPAVDPSESSGA